MADKAGIRSFSGRYQFLSNFFPCLVIYEGVAYSSAEHAFQAAKTLSIPGRGYVAQARRPGEAKRRGRAVVLRSDWEEVKEAVMLGVLRSKFEDEDLRRQLVETGDAELIEGNTWGDRYWGVDQRQGLNRLGMLLMHLREEITGG